MKHLLFGAALGLCILFGWSCVPDKTQAVPSPQYSLQWEYKTFVVNSKVETVDGGAVPSSIDVKDTELNALGQAGWELVGVWEEQDTVFQNLGNEKYVTGIQPNVRTKRVVFAFKRTVKQ